MIAKRSPLYDWHASNSARFTEVGGWEVPDAYGKVEGEYAALRNGAGLIDLCHESRFRLEGEHAAQFLNELTTFEIEHLSAGNSMPTFLCNDRGGIIDLVTIYRDPNYFLLFGNGAVRYEALDWLEGYARRREDLKVNVVDLSQAQGQIGLRGPGALALLERVSFGQRFGIEEGQANLATIGTARCLVLRRILGDGGFDIVAGSIYIQPIWEKLADAARATGARPVGFAAREIVRIEGGQPAMIREIEEDTTPLEINQEQRVDFQKQRFIGRRALLHSTSSEFARKLVFFKMERDGSVSSGSEILYDGLPIGFVTSACMSPMQRASIGMGFVNALKASPGTRIGIRNSDGQVHTAEIAKPYTAQVATAE